MDHKILEVVNVLVKEKRFPVTYQSERFIYDKKTGEIEIDEHGHPKTEEIRERKIRVKRIPKFLVRYRNQKGIQQSWMYEADFVSIFGKKKFKSKVKEYLEGNPEIDIEYGGLG